MHLIETDLGPSAHATSVTIEIHRAPGTNAAFGVQVCRPGDPSGAVQKLAPEACSQTDAEGLFAYAIPQIDAAIDSTLGLVVARLDAAERVDREGSYTVVLRAGSQVGAFTAAAPAWAGTPSRRGSGPAWLDRRGLRLPRSQTRSRPARPRPRRIPRCSAGHPGR
jgi:hypothetical protein